MIEVDTSRLTALCAELGEALTAQGSNGDCTVIMLQETRKLLAQIVRFIPPKTQAIGNAAVKRELKSLFSEASTDLIDSVGSARGVENIDTFIGSKDKKSLRLRWDRLDPLGDRMKQNHRSYLNKRGNIPKAPRSGPGEWRARVVVPQGALAPYIASVQRRVGRAKASWAQVGLQIGVQGVPGYIRRHFPSPHAIDIVNLSDGAFPQITFGSRSPGVSRESAKISDAVRVRCEAIMKRIKLITSGYSQDVAKGMRIRSRAARTGGGGNDAIS